MKNNLSLIAGAAVIAGLALAGPAAAAGSNAQDAAFVTHAAQAGMAEVQLAGLALQKSKTPAVVSFATHMQTDHSKANAQLSSIAHSQGLTVPASVGSKNQMLMDKLQAASGSAFDSQYLKSQLQAHQEAIALFEKEASSGQNADLVAFAKQTLPTLERHLAMDKRDIAKIGGGAVGMR